MVLATIFELLGAITVGARTADTIKNGIIPNSAFQGNAGVQMLAFACALAAASSWVMWCTKHSAHVSSTYSLISAVAGVGVATVGVGKVQWGWNAGKGLGAIFAGLFMAPAIAAGFAGIIFMLIKVVVHMRKNPAPVAVYTSPFWFLIAGTICTLSIVYKGSPKLGLNKKPTWYIVSVTLGTGFGVAALSALFFVPYLHARIIKKDNTLKPWHILMGPALWFRPAPSSGEAAIVPNYVVVQEEPEDPYSSANSVDEKNASDDEKTGAAVATHARRTSINPQVSYAELREQSDAKLRAKLIQGRGPMGWALRFLRDHPMGAGRIYELHNLKMFVVRLPAVVTAGLLYGMHYDIHAAQIGIAGTPDGERMKGVYSHATMYANESEYTYSFVQILTACTASFAHGANDIGNSVGPWAVLYGAWSTGKATASKAPVPLWQIAVLALFLIIGFVTYGYNIMRGKLSCCMTR